MLATLAALSSVCPPTAPALQLVQSIPVGDFDIGLAPCALATWEAQAALARNATRSLDITAMYMATAHTVPTSHWALNATDS